MARVGEQLGDCLLHLEHHELTAQCYELISIHFTGYILGRGMNLAQAHLAYAREYEWACLRAAWSLG